MYWGLADWVCVMYTYTLGNSKDTPSCMAVETLKGLEFREIVHNSGVGVAFVFVVVREVAQNGGPIWDSGIRGTIRGLWSSAREIPKG